MKDKKAKKKYETVEFNNFIGKIIKDKRKELNIAPTDIAAALYITYNTYYSYETGKINIPPENLFKIAKILNISLDDCIKHYFNIKKYKDDFEQQISNINADNKQQQISNINADLDKSIDRVKEIYKSGNKILILAFAGILDIFYRLIKEG
ncbi:MAG: helix-turn-helix domain-containing protein [Deltaproteobacteria bacterium]|nr:helix-turn-helix domain-containing protein [Deltaproteobacteria bacterium]MCL5891888.1 helix-turn-helix domain-containing protein [Deltaproteobacteria bacterium]